MVPFLLPVARWQQGNQPARKKPTKNPPKRVFSILAEALAQKGEGAPA